MMLDTNEDGLPLDLRLDLLVDAELPEEDRRALLLSLDQAPGKWRDLSIRFLERQVEKEGVREMMAMRSGMSSLPADPQERVARNYSFSMRAGGYGGAIAAGLLVAAISAVVTFYAVHRSPEKVDPGILAANDTINTNLPSEAMNYPASLSVNVPLVSMHNVNQPFFPAENRRSQEGEESKTSRRSVVIQPDGAGNAVVIPVNTLPIKFY